MEWPNIHSAKLGEFETSWNYVFHHAHFPRIEGYKYGERAGYEEEREMRIGN
ncbi:unnamed protein product [Dovyalis caffra]|uniref:Uncharacterized protein n=1 Tax=Dovyalis caffra TaxID=77055 RepID=A0AAV1RBY8_9ROSI|nr:unnamed protein product [Dovyalis caffra]